jgi:hypothetical protein
MGEVLFRTKVFLVARVLGRMCNEREIVEREARRDMRLLYCDGDD